MPIRSLPLALAALATLALAAPGTRAQTDSASASPDTARAPTPDSLAARFLHDFATATPDEFDRIDPDADSRTVMHDAVKRKHARTGNIGRVVWRDEHHAVLLLTGTVKADNGGDETNIVRHFSGLYDAREQGGGWSIVAQLPIDTLNHIHAQTLHVDLTPGRGMSVVDTLGVEIGSPYGLAMRLNNDVQLSRLRLDGDSTAWAFGGGVLWLQAAPRQRAQLVLEYKLRDASAPPPDTTGKANDSLPTFGAFHNTDAWHPLFGYNSANDMGDFSITVHVPAAYRLTTTLPQTDSVSNGVRTVVGKSNYPAWLLSLIYDRDWRVQSSDVDGVRFETFTEPAYHFSHDTLAAALRRIDHILGGRFGGPTPPYIALVEDRAIGPRGFAVRMTDAVISGSKAERLEELGIQGPGTAFAHEVSHGWTMNATGPAANMLREGWATFAESVVLRARYGAAVERDYMNRLRNGYMLGSEGRRSILGDPDNGSVHYSKGSWIFHMLNSLLGDSAFDRGVRDYVQRQTDAKPAGYEEFIASMSKAAGHDMTSFTLPWLTQKIIPNVVAKIEAHRVIISQTQDTPPFDLPLEIAITTSAGARLHRTLHLTQRADTLTLPSGVKATAVHVDPNHTLLLQRHWGETVRFELPASKAKDAKTVALVGDFSLDAVPATRVGSTWVVTLPLTEGRYVWSWQLDGKPKAPGQGGDPGSDGVPSLTGIRLVKPLKLLSGAYPK